MATRRKRHSGDLNPDIYFAGSWTQTHCRRRSIRQFLSKTKEKTDNTSGKGTNQDWAEGEPPASATAAESNSGKKKKGKKSQRKGRNVKSQANRPQGGKRLTKHPRGRKGQTNRCKGGKGQTNLCQGSKGQSKRPRGRKPKVREKTTETLTSFHDAVEDYHPEKNKAYTLWKFRAIVDSHPHYKAKQAWHSLQRIDHVLRVAPHPTEPVIQCEATELADSPGRRHQNPSLHKLDTHKVGKEAQNSASGTQRERKVPYPRDEGDDLGNNASAVELVAVENEPVLLQSCRTLPVLSETYANDSPNVSVQSPRVPLSSEAPSRTAGQATSAKVPPVRKKRRKRKLPESEVVEEETAPANRYQSGTSAAIPRVPPSATD